MSAYVSIDKYLGNTKPVNKLIAKFNTLAINTYATPFLKLTFFSPLIVLYNTNLSTLIFSTGT